MTALHFGGTFDPVHHGHLITARAAAEAVGAARVVLLPNAQSPHRRGHDAAPADDRLAMLRLAVAGDDLFDVDDRELRRPPPSYTADTCREMVAEGTPRPGWLIGADQLAALPRWHDSDWLLSHVRFVVMRRPGQDVTTDLDVDLVDTPLIGISATDVRARVAAGRGIRYLVPDAVADHIAGRGLYR